MDYIDTILTMNRIQEVRFDAIREAYLNLANRTGTNWDVWVVTCDAYENLGG